MKIEMVEISGKPYEIGVTTVTQLQWREIMGTEPWKGKDYVREGDDYPAVYVSWNDAVEFCEKLSDKECSTYRLPTEAEWEYACRGGTQTAFSFGDDGAELEKYAWFHGNAGGVGEPYAHRVAQKLPNAFGLYDMHGNVFEYCSDWYDESQKCRVLRGGSWYNDTDYCSARHRIYNSQWYRDYDFGFRLARTLKT